MEEPYTLFYSRPWLGLTRDGREIDGEADFVIVHPESGILSIEVKGGEIHYDPAAEMWTSTDRYEIVHRIKNPALQAKTSKHQILEKLRGSGWKGGRIRARHAVIFPDCERANQDLAADLPLSICAFVDDMSDLGSWVTERMSTPALGKTAEVPLGSHGVEVLELLLARPILLRTPLGHVLKEEEQQIVLLTDEQFQLLDGFDSYLRLAVAGGAGTGKTSLAIEKARRCAAAGRMTLLVCYNRPLSEYLKRSLNGLSGLTVMTFHELCLFAARKNQIAIPPDVPAVTLFGELLPKALETAMCRGTGRKFDAIVVDEGQDFQPSWWTPLESCLENSSTGALFVFYDDHQQLYPWPITYLKGMPQAPFRLTRNVRNAKPIFEEARPFFGNCVIRPAGPKGPPVERHRVSNCQEAHVAIARLVDVLIEKEKVPLSSITVLLAHEDFSRTYSDMVSLGKFRTCKAEDPQEGCLVVETVRRFKGLESAVVILVWSGPQTCEAEITYVALTRARGQLHQIVIG